MLWFVLGREIFSSEEIDLSLGFGQTTREWLQVCQSARHQAPSRHTEDICLKSNSTNFASFALPRFRFLVSRRKIIVLHLQSTKIDIIRTMDITSGKGNRWGNASINRKYCSDLSYIKASSYLMRDVDLKLIGIKN